jgi:HAE1 family hydrophobic/amphiphilic exporter-1
MGISIIGGLISSTLLTLIVVPAAFTYIDRFRIWSAALLKRVFAAKPVRHDGHVESGHLDGRPAPGAKPGRKQPVIST